MCFRLEWLFQRGAVSCPRSLLCWLGNAKLDDARPRPLPRISGRAATPPALLTPLAACKPFLSKYLSCLNSVARSAPPTKPAPNSCLATFSHSCPSIEARKICQNPQSSIPTPPALRLHLLPSQSFQDVCRMGTQLCCKSATMTADRWPLTHLQRTAGLLAIIAVAILAHTFPMLGLNLWLYSQSTIHCLMTLQGIWVAGSTFGRKGAIVVVRHLASSSALSCLSGSRRLIHVGGAPTSRHSVGFLRPGSRSP